MHIRRCTYTVRGEHVSLPFITCVADQHPEIDDSAPPAPPTPIEERLRYMTQAYIHAAHRTADRRH